MKKIIMLVLAVLAVSFTQVYAATEYQPVFWDGLGVESHRLLGRNTDAPIWIKATDKDTVYLTLETFYALRDPCSVSVRANWYYGYYVYTASQDELTYHECKRKFRDASWDVPKKSHNKPLHGQCPLCGDDDIRVRLTSQADRWEWQYDLKYKCKSCAYAETYHNYLPE